eukprot:314723-Prorocentrum_minimum.AAC.4
MKSIQTFEDSSCVLSGLQLPRGAFPHDGSTDYLLPPPQTPPEPHGGTGARRAVARRRCAPEAVCRVDACLPDRLTTNAQCCLVHP